MSKKNKVQNLKILFESSHVLEKMVTSPKLFEKITAQRESRAIVEYTDVDTALNLRLVSHTYQDLIDTYEVSLTKAFVDKLDGPLGPAGLEIPQTLPHLLGIHVCRELARMCASRERVPNNNYMFKEGIPENDPLGDELREQIARGFMVMWKLSRVVPRVNTLDTDRLIQEADSEDIEGFTNAAIPWSPSANTSSSSTLLLDAERYSRKSLILKLRKATDHRATLIAREKALCKMWHSCASTLTEREVIDFHLALARLPSDFIQDDFPWPKAYDQPKAWNWVPSFNSFDGELWFDSYVLRRGPRFIYNLWREPNKPTRTAAWNEHIQTSSAVRDFEIPLAIDTRAYLFTRTALGQRVLASKACADFDRAYGRYSIESDYRQRNVAPPEDEDPIAYVQRWREQRMMISTGCFGSSNQSYMQQKWQQRVR
ncbi:MAG: hypothetical protein Q9160_003759 [Pyrenula sp. 1 TL-2023]